MKSLKTIQFITLILLLLVVGVFWGNYFSFSRSYDAFSLEELIHIAQVIVNNLAMPMRFISLACIGFMLWSAFLNPKKKSTAFFLSIASIAFIITSIVITVVVEVPINNQIIQWTSSTAPANWEEIRNRWQYYNIIRTICALISFVLFSAAVIRPFQKTLR